MSVAFGISSVQTLRCALAPAAATQRSSRRAVDCEGKGFGDATPAAAAGKSKAKGKRKSNDKKKAARISSDQAVEKAVRIAEGGSARPVNEKEAAKGRLDYVQVRNWGSGKADDLGSLEVDSVATVSSDPSRPFYEQLARHLELCHARGALDTLKDTRALPPFEKWSFKKRRYVEYLVDLLCVHRALEAATLAALQPFQEGLDEMDEESRPTEVAPELLTGDYATSGCDALHPFVPGSGFGRSMAIANDLHLIAQHTPGDDFLLLEASPHADRYAARLVSLAAIAQDEERSTEEKDAARLTLLAHVYSCQVTQLTTGMRIGAAAAERLDLFPIGATKLFEDYPESLGDPLHAFMASINGVGEELTSRQRQMVFAELPRAFRLTSEVFSALAHED